MKTLQSKLQDMKHGLFVYRGEVVELLGYVLDTGDEGNEYELLLSNGRTLTGHMDDLNSKLSEFSRANSTVVKCVEQKMNQVSSFNPDVMTQMRDAVLDSIRQVREDPKNVSQAKQVFQGVNTLINLAKTELDYRKYMDEQNKRYAISV